MESSGGQDYGAPAQPPHHSNNADDAQMNNRAALPKTARDLRVEDALQYRDQVKFVFADRPNVYNEFLEIMRKFKSQAITTPEVINRVRVLFRGYPSLIVGFNAFLPDEIGYKIELTEEEQRALDNGQDKSLLQPHLAVQHQAHAPSAMSQPSLMAAASSGPATGYAQVNRAIVPGNVPISGMNSNSNPNLSGLNVPVSAAPAVSTNSINNNGPAAAASVNVAVTSVPANIAVPVTSNNNNNTIATANSGGSNPASTSPTPTPTTNNNNNTAGVAAAATNAAPPASTTNAANNNVNNNANNNDPNRPPLGAQSGQMQQAHAIHYVTKIRNRFSNEPETYRSFLKILHTYQKEQKGIKEVLEQVSSLFADHIDLLMEFTYFLPDAVQDQAKERLERAARESEARRASLTNNNSSNNNGMGNGMLGGAHMTMSGVANNNANNSAMMMNTNANSNNTGKNAGAGGKKSSKKEAAALAAAAAANNNLNNPNNALNLGLGNHMMLGNSSNMAANAAMNNGGGAMSSSYAHYVDNAGNPVVIAGNKRARDSNNNNNMNSNQQYLTLSGMSLLQQQQHLAELNNNNNNGPANKKANLGNNALNAMNMNANLAANHPLAGLSQHHPYTQQQLLAAQQALLAQQQQLQLQQQQNSGNNNGNANNRKQGRGRKDQNNNNNATNNMNNNNNLLLLQQQQLQQQLHFQQLQQHNNNPNLNVNNANNNNNNNLSAQQQLTHLQRHHPSVTAERKFFDTVKDVLLNVSRDTWAEFVKLLELFANNALTKESLLELTHDILSTVHNSGADLYHEFKRLLENKSDYIERKEDLWFSVPLSEIDFTQCLRCTPSYRQLPQNYPKPKCSDRSFLEESMLNDNWVSIPIGSEESYSFKHMRKNQYEEALFKCEDERFEIDMIIDSNMSTIRVLDPLAEEIVAWKQMMASSNNNATGTNNAGNGGKKGGKHANNGANNANNSVSNMAATNLAPRLSLHLEKRQLSTIHLNAIARIYGDHGEEILELLRKNPAGTIPVVLKRLRQKDVEWRKARAELSKHWKDLQEKNHYKSFDHRSFYFRQHDKKYLSTKQLVADIAAMTQLQATVLHQQQLQQQQLQQQQLYQQQQQQQQQQLNASANNSNADNHANAIASTTTTTTAKANASTSNTSTNNANTTTIVSGTVAAMMRHDAHASVAELQQSGICLAISEDMKTALANSVHTMNHASANNNSSRNNSGTSGISSLLQPQMVLNYDHDHHIVHRDIFRIVCHAAETSLQPVSDRERLAALWRDLLRVFFNLPAHYLYPNHNNNASTAGHTTFAAAAAATASSTSSSVLGGIGGAAWSVGTRVLTAYGSGVVSGYREADDMYEVKLSFGKAYVRSVAIVGAEQLSNAGLAAIGVSKGGSARADIIWNGLVVGDASGHDKVYEPCKVFFGTQMCYVFLRLHHTLFVRLRAACILAEEANKERSLHYLGGAQSLGSFGNRVTDTRYAEQPSMTGLSEAYAADSMAEFSSPTNAGNTATATAANNSTNNSANHVSNNANSTSTNNNGNNSANSASGGAAVPLYTAFLGQVLALVEGTIDNARFEDFCRNLLGNKAYVLYTLDKIVSQLMKHLQAMANNDTVMKLIGLFMYHHRHRHTALATSMNSNSTATSSHTNVHGNVNYLDATLYRNHVAQILSNTMEDVFRMQLLCPLEGICATRSEVAVQQLGILTPGSSQTQDHLSAAFNQPSTIPNTNNNNNNNAVTNMSVNTAANNNNGGTGTVSSPGHSKTAALAAAGGGGSASKHKSADHAAVTNSHNAAEMDVSEMQVHNNNVSSANALALSAASEADHTAAAAAHAQNASNNSNKKTQAQVTTSKGRRFALTLGPLSTVNNNSNNSTNNEVKTPKAAVLSDDEEEEDDNEDEEGDGEEDDDEEEEGDAMDLDEEDDDDTDNNKNTTASNNRQTMLQMDLDDHDDEEDDDEDNINNNNYSSRLNRSSVEGEDNDRNNNNEEEEEDDDDESNTDVNRRPRVAEAERKIVFSPRMRH